MYELEVLTMFLFFWYKMIEVEFPTTTTSNATT
jgi:hypothetical protein